MQVNNAESPRTAKAHAQLKAQITSELKNKRQCNYHPYECTQLALDNYEYCQRHILCDKSAPFKPCSFVYNSGKRCCYAAFKSNKKEMSYCTEHALKAHLIRAKQGARMQPPKNAESLLTSLSHYVRKPKERNSSATSSKAGDDNLDRSSPDEGECKTTKALDPFVDVDATVVNASVSDVLDLCSESESDAEITTFSNVWHDAHADSSENESIDSDNEDLLKHADVLSAEEVTLVAKDKLIRLQSLYMDQYSHLYHMLREKRRRYLHALKREKETCCSISSQPRDTPKEQRMYKKLKEYNQYHRKFGTDAILRKRLNEMRLKITDGAPYKPPSYHTKCTFSEGGVKCVERALPVARHCRKHIMKDPNQVLFRACGKKRSDMECATPVEAIFDDQTCVLHRDIPPLRIYSQLRKDSESDVDDMQLLENKHVKTEIINYNSPIIPMDESLVSMKDEPMSADEDAITVPPIDKDDEHEQSSDINQVKLEQATATSTTVPSSDELLPVTSDIP